MEKRIFTSESVTEGHPDKICDQLSDGILDEILKQDPNGRVACECCCTTNYVLVMGEITTTAKVDYEAVVRNIIRENIESEVSSTIPQPKVMARRQSDEWRAKILEDMLRNELDRLPMETLNDLMERTVPIQGGGYWLVEWDNSKRTHSTVGDVSVSILHPKQVIPQDGVFGSVEDMDAVIIKLPQTRAYIKRVYGKDVDEGEDAPEARTLDNDADTAEDLVTQYVAYFRNDNGGIGKFSWVNDTVLEDMEDFEARRLRKCAQCGKVLEPDADFPIGVSQVEFLLADQQFNDLFQTSAYKNLLLAMEPPIMTSLPCA